MTYTGVDIASWQHPNGAAIDWPAVPGEFAIIKATEGTSYTNPYYKGDAANATKAKKAVGAYHFVTGEPGILQANYFLGVVGDLVPLFLDVETPGITSQIIVDMWHVLHEVNQRNVMIYAPYGYQDLMIINGKPLTPLWKPVGATDNNSNISIDDVWVTQTSIEKNVSGFQSNVSVDMDTWTDTNGYYSQDYYWKFFDITIPAPVVVSDIISTFPITVPSNAKTLEMTWRS